MKRILSVMLCAVLVFGLSSCGQTSNDSDIDDSYLEGLEKGERNMFLNLWQASTFSRELVYGETWETEDFSLSFTDYKVEATYSSAYDDYDHLLKCDLTLKKFTTDEGIENKNIYFGMYSYSSPGKWEVIVADYEDYYFSAILEDDYTFGSYTSNPSFQLYDNQQYVGTIIVINGTLYKISYRLIVE